MCTPKPRSPDRTVHGRTAPETADPPAPTPADTAADPWVGPTGQIAHPDAPTGGGGPGIFKAANPLGADSDSDTAPHPRSPAATTVDPNALQAAAQPTSATTPNPPPEILKDETKKIGGIDVTIKADQPGVAGIQGAETRLNLKTGVPGYNADESDKVTKINGVTTITGTILTKYGTGSKPKDLSAYGRGTTKADKASGDVTLGFHESCHREDFKTYLTNNALPTYGGKVGQSVTDFKDAGTKYLADVDKYMDDALAKSEADTDEVGDPKRSDYFNNP